MLLLENIKVTIRRCMEIVRGLEGKFYGTV